MNLLKNLLKQIKDFFTIYVPEYEESWSEVCPSCETPMKKKKNVSTCRECGITCKEITIPHKPRVHKRK